MTDHIVRLNIVSQLVPACILRTLLCTVRGDRHTTLFGICIGFVSEKIHIILQSV